VLVSPQIENTLRRILEHYFTTLGSVDYKKLCDKFDGPDKVMCNSLFSWINAGSHAALDDAYITPSDAMVKNALRVFKEIFAESGNPGHYEMMNPPVATGAVAAKTGASFSSRSARCIAKNCPMLCITHNRAKGNRLSERASA